MQQGRKHTNWLLAVRLDDEQRNTGTVVAYPTSVDEYERLITDSDRPRMRLWRGKARIGERVSLS